MAHETLLKFSYPQTLLDVTQAVDLTDEQFTALLELLRSRWPR